MDIEGNLNSAGGGSSEDLEDYQKKAGSRVQKAMERKYFHQEAWRLLFPV